MKRNSFLASVLVVGIVLFLAGVWFGLRSAQPAAPASQRKILYYVDPMNPSHTSDRPGVAPCGMKMEPVYAGTEPRTGNWAAPGIAAPGAVRINMERQQRIGLRTAAVQRMPITQTIRLPGRVMPDDRRIYRLTAGIDGIIRDVSNVATGTQVEKDQWLATFSAPNARAAMQGLITAVDVLDREKKMGQGSPAALGLLEENVRLAKDRLDGLGLSPLQIEEIRSTRVVPSALRILAPARGVILTKDPTPGLKFEKGAEWYRIADLRHVWVLADVSAQEQEFVQPGAKVEVFAPGNKKSLPAKVSESLPLFDPGARTLKVRFELENPHSILRPDMFVDIVLSVDLPPTLAVPVDAVLDSGQSATVYLAGEHGVFEPRQVQTGRRLQGLVEILDGLQPGDQIVTAGHFLLDSESRIQLAAFPKREREHRDPICGMQVNEKEARAAQRVSSYQGHTYFFCNVACQQNFEKNPARFIQKTPGASATQQTMSEGE